MGQFGGKNKGEAVISNSPLNAPFFPINMEKVIHSYLSYALKKDRLQSL